MPGTTKQIKLWAVITITYGGLFTLGLIDNLRGPLYPSILKHFLVDSKSGSLIFAPSSFAGLLASLSSPWWLRSYGSTKAMTVSLLMMGIGSLIFALTIVLNFGFNPMIAGAMVFGFGNGLCSICINILLADKAPAHLRRQLLSGLHSMYGVSSLLAPFVPLLFMQAHWGYSFFLAAVPAFVLFVVALFSVFFSSKAEGEEKLPAHKTSLPLREGFYFPGLLLGLYVCSEVLLSTRLSQYLEGVLGWSYEAAATYNFYFFACLTLGRIVMAVIPFKVNNHRILLLSLVCSPLCFLLGLRYPPFLIVTALFMSYFFPVCMDVVTERFGQHSGAYVAKSLMLIGIGLSLMHYLVGLITDSFGLTKALLTGPLLLLGALFIFLKFEYLKQPGPQNAMVETSSL